MFLQYFILFPFFLEKRLPNFEFKKSLFIILCYIVTNV